MQFVKRFLLWLWKSSVPAPRELPKWEHTAPRVQWVVEAYSETDSCWKPQTWLGTFPTQADALHAAYSGRTSAPMRAVKIEM